MSNRILIVEDDPAMSVALRDGFEFEKHTVEMAADGVEGLRLAAGGDHDLIILDVMLPKKSGLDVCRELRKLGSHTPIIMLTARGQEIDKIVGLKLGADDYVTKPFSFMELLARVEAVLRRTIRPSAGEEFGFGDVQLDFRTYQATKRGDALDLTPREFRILRYFIDHSDEVVSREALLNHVWGYDSSAFTRTVDTHMARLRQKVENVPAEPKHLITVHRVGYKFVP
ncbi:MAG: two-component system, OmpR family, alkaline phosphatase synthesis response regulator PhoP [Acidobacteriota bacterium]|jgi:two-component system alkaline phosphatase synthesis response regulator PhoP|nr:two-component system, OmpR family, alkaline phosphatase synthesis response regulator PhoP [Acidobacteriota bacterium]